MRLRHLFRAVMVCALASGVIATGGAAAVAEMTDPPACEQDINGACLGGPGGMNVGVYIGTAAGRTFVTNDDVTFISAYAMAALYVPAEWDSFLDFVDAASTYWNLNSPSDRVCVMVDASDPRWPARGCQSVSFAYAEHPDGSETVTLTPHR